ncbi:DUF421 domain-containing protein [soil metagenome]
MTASLLFESWTGLLRVVLIGGLAYGALIALLRVTGKRTLSKMNAFDLIVTVALGSTLATVLLSQDVALAEGIAAFALLCGLQFAVTFLSVRSPGFRDLIKGQPRLLFYRGSFLGAALKSERVTEDEVLAALRAQGHGGLASVEAVVLETDGTLSVVASAGGGEAMAPVAAGPVSSG